MSCTARYTFLDGDNSARIENSIAVEKPTEMEKPAYSILFIGNSYTYYNDMPTAMFEKSLKMGYQAEVSAITKGAHILFLVSIKWQFN